jgi:hypothetical protein
MVATYDIAVYALKAGIIGEIATPTAVAIALAESGGDRNAHNTKGADNSYGLWQINMKAHTTAELGISKNEDLFDPATNAKAMAQISGGGKNWGPWTTYQGLKFWAYYPQAVVESKRAITVLGINVVADAGGQVVDDAKNAAQGVVDGVTDLANTVKESVQTPIRILNWLGEPGTWVRIGYFGLGFMLLIAGGILLAAPIGGQIVAGAVPIGKVGKAVGKVIK